ncbi:hypothetical protein WMF18_22850 [Sorangium sp. So ce315]|uniref:hypothetical protein n=1 Tax=Sorangium sp. So ce315 TaxID=3133299 RepID=UPI003F60C083
MACVWALTRDMQPGDALPPEADGLVGLGPPVDVVRGVLEQLPPERRGAVVLRELRAAVQSPWLGDRALDRCWRSLLSARPTPWPSPLDEDLGPRDLRQ